MKLEMSFGAVILSALAASPLSGQATVERTLALAPDGGFRVMVMEGTVRARAWDRDSVRVVARLDPAARRGFYMGVTPGGRGGKMGVEGDGRAEIDVMLPRRATLWVKTAGATVEVVGIEGIVDAFSVTGDIRLEGSPRSLHAESMGGAVELAGEPGVARIRTGAGAIAVNGGGPDLTLSSVNGRITLQAATPLRRATVETVSGSVSIRSELATESTLTVNSHDGSVELALPAETSAEFVISTLEGELRNRLTAGGARKATGLRGRELSFTTGFGGAEVTVRTFSGAVTVRPIRDD